MRILGLGTVALSVMCQLTVTIVDALTKVFTVSKVTFFEGGRLVYQPGPQKAPIEGSCEHKPFSKFLLAACDYTSKTWLHKPLVNCS